MKKLLLGLLLLAPFFIFSQEDQNILIGTFLDEWHADAANADMEAYFEKIDENGIFIGTDATENWTKAVFYEWSRPYFDNGKAWTFEAFERNVYFSEDGILAWFDEKLHSSSGDLRGSGVVSIKGESIKIMHYVLSVPVPNEKFKGVMELIMGEE